MSENTKPQAIKLKWGAARVLSALAVLFLAVFVWSYVREIRRVVQQPVSSWTEDTGADCAVVVTGGPNRIREGVDLLARKVVQKLIISGVHPQAGLRDIFALWPFYGELHDQDVILERRSRTTFGNAQQSLPLVEALRCRDLLLITSRTHMQRALKTFRAEFPATIPIIPRAVTSASVEPSWSEIGIEAFKSLFYSVWAY
jgi:uncharacterized SAM-binding protein YcdF (DUF218 family)